VFPVSVYLPSLAVFVHMVVASEKVLWKVPPTILDICLPNGCCFIEFFGGFRQLCLRFISQSASDS